MHFSHVLGSPYVVYSGNSICDIVMGSGLWGGEHVHIAIHIVIHTGICSFKQFLVDFIAYKLFELRCSEITGFLMISSCVSVPFEIFS